jgi:hypothetical protein
MEGKFVNWIVLVAGASVFLLLGAPANGQGQPDISSIRIKTNPLGNSL